MLISLGFDDCYTILPVYTTFTHRTEHTVLYINSCTMVKIKRNMERRVKQGLRGRIMAKG